MAKILNNDTFLYSYSCIKYMEVTFMFKLFLQIFLQAVLAINI